MIPLPINSRTKLVSSKMPKLFFFQRKHANSNKLSLHSALITLKQNSQSKGYILLSHQNGAYQTRWGPKMSSQMVHTKTEYKGFWNCLQFWFSFLRILIIQPPKQKLGPNHISWVIHQTFKQIQDEVHHGCMILFFSTEPKQS
jgi:hypothetical protein